jgi:hypothetical protein
VAIALACVGAHHAVLHSIVRGNLHRGPDLRSDANNNRTGPSCQIKYKTMQHITTKLYDRTREELTFEEVERIKI